MERCDECNFVYDLSQATSAGQSIVVGAGELAALLEEGRVDVGSRRESQLWSPLEYACHLRDVLIVQRERVLLARRVDCPSWEPMGREERADHDGYSEQQPTHVARQLSSAAQMFENVLSRLGSDDWEKPLMYNYPERSQRSLRWVAVHTMHEVRHHLLDIRKQLPTSIALSDIP